MNVQLDPKMVSELAAAAIMTTLSAEQRNILISNAIQYLLTPAGTGYNKQSSPIESAFNEALRRHAVIVAEQMLEGDDVIKGKLQQLISEAVHKLFTDNRDATIGRVVQSITEGLCGKGY